MSKKRQADPATLLTAILAQVTFDGWSQTALLNGVKAAGVTEAILDQTFPQGVRDVITAFSAAANDAMLTQIKREKLFSRMRVRDKVAYAVRTRLEYLAPHREAMRQLCLWYALPHHAPTAIKNLAVLCDTIWQAAGDTSTDFNFYTKRGLLGYVIKTTTLFWLNDESDDQQATWDFLDRRIAEVLFLGQTAGKLADLPQHFNQLGVLADIAKKFRRAG